LRAYEERSSLRGINRTFGVARNTVSKWIKKSSQPARPEHDAAGT
jgi:transposase-like protein